MTHQTKIQCISRANCEQWCTNLPTAVAKAMELKKGETVQWFIDDRQRLVMERNDTQIASLKKKLRMKNLRSKRLRTKRRS